MADKENKEATGAEGSETAAEVGGAETPAAAAADTEVATEAQAWSGRVEELDKAEWYTKLDEGVRGNLKAGVGTVLKSLQGDYTRKSQELSAARKTLEAEQARVKDSERRAMRLLYGDEDPVKVKDEEIANIKGDHKKVIDGLVAEYEDKLTAAAKAHEEAVAAVNTNAKNAEAKVTEYEKKLTEAKTAAQDAEAAEISTWLEESAPDVSNSPEAFAEFVNLLGAYGEAEKALKLTRALYPEPKKAESPPDSVDLMNLKGGTETAPAKLGDNESFQSIFERMRREAQEEHSRFLNSNE